MCSPPSVVLVVTAKETPETPVCHAFSALFFNSFFLCLVEMQASKSITTLTSNLLEFPFLCKLLIQSLQLLNQVSTSSDDSILGCEGSISLNTQLKGCEQRVRDFVGGEQNVG
jgi:hypothetical protein